MSDDSRKYAKDYAKVVRYSEASHSDLPAMLAAIHPKSWQGKSWAEHTPRLVAADFMQELGRDKEAELLRDTKKHIYYHDGEVKDTAELEKEIAGSRPTPHRTRLTDPLDASDRQHLQTALWSSHGTAEEDEDVDDIPLDQEHGVDDIHPRTAAEMVAEWRHFKNENQHLIGDDPENLAPHHFWLTKEGHGTGFRNHDDYYGGNSHLLEEASGRYGQRDLYTLGDGQVHG